MLQHADPGWTWQPSDTAVFLQAFAVGSSGTALTIILLAALTFEEKQRRQSAEGKGSDAESRPLLDRSKDSEPSPRLWRIIALVAIGMSPLILCVSIGESLGNVLFAMVAMHWIAMLVFPALYYTIKSHEERGFATSTLAFYSECFNTSTSQLCFKVFRGCAIGLPVFLCLVSCYFLFRCNTYGSLVCVKNFERPLEDYGMKVHSMPFRLAAATYFTFWNPLIEELFWRVFLHREVGLELQVTSVTPPLPDGVPWRHLWKDIIALIPVWPPATSDASSAKLRWGVSCMYASYHTWPMKVLFLSNQAWWLHILGGFVFLVFLGRFFLVLRENSQFGLASAYAVHAWVDAGFAVLCLFEVQSMMKALSEHHA
mmetsp:Transcript_1190/g.2020  ORF Transcript_1190/g.2020 Transcript_1190/m.2020 type:complete len:370 (+) Transcript_1190:70-1179(+)